MMAADKEQPVGKGEDDMKKITTLFMTAIMMVGLSFAALADRESETFTFSENFKFNGTLVEKGTYKITFDDQTNELMIRDTDETLATAKVRIVPADRKARNTSVSFSRIGSDLVFTGVIFDGESQSMVLENTSDSSTVSQ
jgi:hypothetical protein